MLQDTTGEKLMEDEIQRYIQKFFTTWTKKVSLSTAKDHASGNSRLICNDHVFIMDPNEMNIDDIFAAMTDTLVEKLLSEEEKSSDKSMNSGKCIRQKQWI